METNNKNCESEKAKTKEETMKAFDAQKARKVLERVEKFLGILIREDLVKDAPFLDEGELENVSDLADDVWEVLQMEPRNCDKYATAEEAWDAFDEWADSYRSQGKTEPFNEVGWLYAKAFLAEESEAAND